MKVSQLVADWIATVNPRVYTVCGAGAMHLNDAICSHPALRVTAMHHEQAATFAAEADARVSGKPGIVHVTAGPGGTNTLTGVAAAYVDSIPLIVIAGQVTTGTLKPPGLRQLGMNELDMVAMAKPVTKYAVTVRKAEDILYELGQALHIATSGRPGPVWVEIPLDVQAAEVDAGGCRAFSHPLSVPELALPSLAAAEVARAIAGAHRPVIMIGNGVRLAGAVDDCVALADMLPVPVVSSWGGADIIPTDHPCYIGRCGIFGCRPANLTVQGADLIVAIGTRLSVPQTGHAQHLFAPNAVKIIVDIDRQETKKQLGSVPVVAGAADFIRSLLTIDIPHSRYHDTWLHRARGWRDLYPVMCPEYRNDDAAGINAYAFVEELAKQLPDDAIVVTDVGFAYIPTMQSMPVRKGQRLIHSGGVSPMGWGLPAAIGACIASGGKRKVVCLTGDGGLMLNLQELQTIAHHKLPISIFVYANNGYATIQAMQQNHFGRHVVSSPETGMSLPDFVQIAIACGMRGGSIMEPDCVSRSVRGAIRTRLPVLWCMHMAPDQAISPRVQTKVDAGKFIPTPIDDMWPYLSREELAEARAS